MNSSSAQAERIFVHFTAIEMSGYRSLDEGTEVEYLLYQGPKGLLAQDVIPAAVASGDWRGPPPGLPPARAGANI